MSVGQVPTGGAGVRSRWRVAAVMAVFALALAGTAVYLTVSRHGQQQAVLAAPAQQIVSLSSVANRPHIAFRNTAAGPHHGRVAMVPTDSPGSGRAITEFSCERVYAARQRVLCLSAPNPVGGAAAEVREPGSSPRSLGTTGMPSRARLSADGRLATTTSFVAGDSYAEDSFSTRTVITPLQTGDALDLESFRLVHRGAVTRPADRNFWGVTFAGDGDTFYVTAAFGDQTWLARGSVRSRVVTTLRADAECPSLSPDGRRIAYKKQGDRVPGDWRLAVLDLATGAETVLAEQRSVDDQVEWLDDDRVLYALPRDGGGGVLDSDIWVLPADGSAAPTVLVADASSPAVVRQP